MVIAGALVIGCEGDGGVEDSTRSAQEPLKNFTNKTFTTFASCTALNLWDGVIENENVVFPSGCVYKGQVKFMSGDATLDCNSGTIEGSPDSKVIVKPVNPDEVGMLDNPHTAQARYYVFPKTDPPPPVPLLEPLLAGIVIGSPNKVNGCRPDAPAVEDVTIRNCTIRGFYQGIRLDRQFPQDQPVPPSTDCTTPDERIYYTGYQKGKNPPYTYAEEYELERTQLYNRSPKRVRIVDSIVERNGHAGIYVIAYSQHFSIEGTTVRENGSVGIYLSHESRYTTIERSLIYRNGYGSNSALYRVPRVTEVEPPGREGISIDSSAHNTLSRNELYDNYKGGITLYKNCGEGDELLKPATIRKMHSDYNRIVHNTIHTHVDRTQGNLTSGFGIWIAMRQGQEYSTTDGAFEHCRDPYVTMPDGKKRNHDYANFNTIAYNSFTNNWLSVRVSDDFNQIVGNQFYGLTTYDMYIGDTFRQQLEKPVFGTSVVKNRSWTEIRSGGRSLMLVAGSGDDHFFEGNMYYDRRVDSSTGDQVCRGAEFSDCTRPPGQLLHGVFWD